MPAVPVVSVPPMMAPVMAIVPVRGNPAAMTIIVAGRGVIVIVIIIVSIAPVKKRENKWRGRRKKGQCYPRSCLPVPCRDRGCKEK
jgi:hypothetical protein